MPKCTRCKSDENVKYEEEFEDYFCQACITNINTPELTLSDFLKFETETETCYDPGEYPIPKHIMMQLPEPADPRFDVYEYYIKHVGVDEDELSWLEQI